MILTMSDSIHVPASQERQDSESSSGSGGGLLRGLLHRPKQERRASVPSRNLSGSIAAALQQQELQQQQSIAPPHALTGPQHLRALNEFEENPPITASPGSTPPKKIWEGAYNKFLRGNSSKHNKSTSPTLSSSLESAVSLPKVPEISSKKIERSTGKKSSFTLIPGSRRLVSRTPLSPGKKLGSPKEINLGDARVPPFPSLKVFPRNTSYRKRSDDLDEHLHGGVVATSLASSGNQARGGGLFSSVFSTSSNSNIPKASMGGGSDPLDQCHRRHQSMDTLDVPLKKGVGRSSSLSLSPVHTLPRDTLSISASNAADVAAMNAEQDDPESVNLDDLLASAASTPTSHHFVVSMPGVSQRAYSMSGIAQRATDSIGFSPTMLSRPTSGYLHPRSYPSGYNPEPGCQQELRGHSPPLVPPLPGGFMRSTSEQSQNIGLTLDDSDRSESDDHIYPVRSSGSDRDRVLESSEEGYDLLSNPNVVVETAGYSPSSPSHLFQSNEDMKKAFTKFHNSKYSKDSSSAYLGGKNSSSVNLAAHDGLASHHSSFLRIGGNMAFSDGTMSERDEMHSLRRLETVDEQDISIHKGMRLLKPIQGTEAWQSGRRYLIAPAALSSCPLPAIHKLSGSSIQNASEASSSGYYQGHGTISLGEVLMTYVGEKHHLSLGKWSACFLVLRQNYLFEYETSTPTNGLPRGYVHLQHAAAYAHANFQDMLELQFYASPCAKSDHRTLRIRVQNREDRDHCINCLNTAANLRMEDIWDVAKDRPFGTGRYATVFPATRRCAPNACDTASVECNQCALKVVDKNEFWRRVVKGRERSDTLVRELAVQATLTAKCCSTTSSFLRLRGFFETSDNVVIELEILDGKDLFEHIQSKGNLSEEEAKTIVRDVLVILDCMNRFGLAHRDVKPANILVADPAKHGASVKLGDFGMATFVGVDGLVRGRCGTPGYVAPEILTAGTRAGYSNKVDVFSAGVTLYLMLSGVEPFYGESEQELVEDNTKAKVLFPKKYWSNISADAKDLVQRMLQADPSDRISAKEALQHRWLANAKHNLPSEGGTSNPLGEGICTIM